MKIDKKLDRFRFFSKHRIPAGLLYQSLFLFKTFLLPKMEFTTLLTQVYIKLYSIENLRTKFQNKTEGGLLL